MKALSADSFLARLLGRLTALILRRPRWFFWPQAGLFVLCVVYALPKPYGHLDFDMNQDDLVGPNQKYHENFLRLQKEFPPHSRLSGKNSLRRHRQSRRARDPSTTLSLASRPPTPLRMTNIKSSM